MDRKLLTRRGRINMQLVQRAPLAGSQGLWHWQYATAPRTVSTPLREWIERINIHSSKCCNYKIIWRIWKTFGMKCVTVFKANLIFLYTGARTFHTTPWRRIHLEKLRATQLVTLLRNSKVHRHVHMSPPLIPIISKRNFSSIQDSSVSIVTRLRVGDRASIPGRNS
jgi:hypothetical protein